MGNENKGIEQIKKDFKKLYDKVLKVKKAKKVEKFTKLKNWKQFRANVNKEVQEQ